jgi:hypothetical protein
MLVARCVLVFAYNKALYFVCNNNLAAIPRHLAHLGWQVPCALTSSELLLRRGGTLTVSDVGAIGTGESAMPVLPRCWCWAAATYYANSY